jgi:regulator of protease activity HflC (stomatin/prohibitin superfamily)
VKPLARILEESGQCRMASTDIGSTSRPASPAISGRAVVVEVMTGVPHAMASTRQAESLAEREEQESNSSSVESGQLTIRDRAREPHALCDTAGLHLSLKLGPMMGWSAADAVDAAAVILAEAYRDAQMINGDRDAKASALYAESFGRDPQFTLFYRSLDAYNRAATGPAKSTA